MADHPSAEYLAAVTGLMTSTRTLLEGLQLVPRTGSVTDAVLLALLSKSIVVTEAVVCLLSNGFTDEALGLSRTGMEIEQTVRYMTNKNTVERCERYYNFFAKDKTEWWKLLGTYYPDANFIPNNDMPRIEKMALAYKSPHSWSGVAEGLKGLAKEPDTQDFFEDGTPVDGMFGYEVMYKLASQYVHATVSALDSAHVTLPGDRFRVHRGAGRSTMGQSALRPAYFAVHMNTLRVLRYFNMEDEYPEELRVRYMAVAETY
jgi:Family of unknown function (DUF5677)